MDCGCPFDYPYACPACGHRRITNHCPHDGVQNPCPACGWTDPGKRTPLQHLGLREVPGGDGESRSSGPYLVVPDICGDFAPVWKWMGQHGYHI